MLLLIFSLAHLIGVAGEGDGVVGEPAVVVVAARGAAGTKTRSLS